MSEGTTPLQTSGDNNLKQVTGEDQQKKKKGALARIKDSLKAVPTKIKSGMNTLASKITSPFKRKKGPDTTTDNNKLEDGSSKPQKKPGLFSRTKTRVADMGRSLWKALSPTKNKSANEETLEMSREERKACMDSMADFDMADLDNNPNIMADFAPSANTDDQLEENNDVDFVPSANTDDQLGNGSIGDKKENDRQQTSV